MRRLLVVIAVALGAVIAYLALRAPQQSDEQQIRALVGRVQAAVEEKRIGDVVAELSENYTDSAGNRREAVKGYLFLALRRYETVGSLLQINALTIDGDAANVKLTAFVWSGRRGEIIPQNADRMDFDLDLARAEGWKIERATFDRNFIVQ